MAHRVAPRAEADLDDIWFHVAKQSGSMETASWLIDSITGRFLFLAGLPYAERSGCRVRNRNAEFSRWRLCDCVLGRRAGCLHSQGCTRRPGFGDAVPGVTPRWQRRPEFM